MPLGEIPMKKRAIIFRLRSIFPNIFSFNPRTQSLHYHNVSGDVCLNKASLSPWLTDRRKKYSLKTIAGLLVIVFSTTQICWGQELLLSPVRNLQAVKRVETEQRAPDAQPSALTRLPQTSQDFLSDTLRFSSSTPTTSTRQAKSAEQRLTIETLADGTHLRHVYEGDSIQTAINSAVSGDTVYLHAGTYHELVALKDGVNLKGEDPKTTIINGDSQPQTNVITALGNNRIENLTITGGGAYSGYPASAIRVQGDNVKIRGNLFLGNQDYGIHCWSGTNLLIEENFFKGNHLAIQMPKEGATIRYNTFVSNELAINILGGGAPVVEENIFTGSTSQSIYEYADGQKPSMGYATVRNNTFFNNAEHGSYYGSATPPAVTAQRDGNLLSNPQYMNAAAGDYTLQATSSSYGRGAFLPAGLTAALDRASHINVESSISKILNGTAVIGYRVLYAEGSVEEFYNDGHNVLDTTGPAITILSTMPLTICPYY